MTKEDTELSKSAIQLAVAKAGGKTALAQAIGATRQSVYDWLGGKYCLSAEQAVKIHEATGVALGDLRPDLWDE